MLRNVDTSEKTQLILTYWIKLMITNEQLFEIIDEISSKNEDDDRMFENDDLT